MIAFLFNLGNNMAMIMIPIGAVVGATLSGCPAPINNIPFGLETVLSRR